MPTQADRLYYAKITEDEHGDETYATPVQLARAMTADLSVELAEATLYADDGASEIVKEFKSGTLSLGVDDLGGEVASDLTGAVIDNNGVVISAAEDGGTPVAVGFRAKKSNGKYRYFWLYRIKFGDSLMKSKNFEMAIGEIVWLITLLANQSIMVHNLKHKDSPKDLLTEEMVELLTIPADLASYKSAIMDALVKGTKRNVESENDVKNAVVE